LPSGLFPPPLCTHGLSQAHPLVFMSSRLLEIPSNMSTLLRLCVPLLSYAPLFPLIKGRNLLPWRGFLGFPIQICGASCCPMCPSVCHYRHCFLIFFTPMCSLHESTWHLSRVPRLRAFTTGSFKSDSQEKGLRLFPPSCPTSFILFLGNVWSACHVYRSRCASFDNFLKDFFFALFSSLNNFQRVQELLKDPASG